MCLFFVFVIFVLPFVVGKVGVCHRIVWKANLQHNETEYYCCDDYEEENGICIECKAGYTSVKGKQCDPCPAKNSYGIKCLLTCKCAHNQRCHHVLGCINFSSTKFQITKEGFSTSASLITNFNDREKKKDGEQGYSTFISVITKFNDREKENVDEQDTELLDQKIVVYTICIAGLVIVITICYVCVKCLNNRRSMNGLIENNNMLGNQRELPSPVLFNQGHEGSYERCYDEIDETKMIETKASFEKHGKTTMESDSETSENENEEKPNHDHDDGYLNPYQQIVKDPDSHDYKTTIANVDESLEIQLQNSQEVGYVDAISSNLRDRTYLEVVDQSGLSCLQGRETTIPSNDMQVGYPKKRENSGVIKIKNSQKAGTSMLELASETNYFEQKHESLALNKRLSI